MENFKEDATEMSELMGISYNDALLQILVTEHYESV